MSSNSLLEAFKTTKYQLGGHGTRNVDVLKEAFDAVRSQEESDLYGTGNFIEAFENKMAAYLGKETAVFFQAVQWPNRSHYEFGVTKKGINKVAYHPLSHLEIHEEDGLKKLHHIEPILLADKTRVIELDDVLNMNENIACLLLELPQREIGGQLPDYETLFSISQYCREKGIKLQLDGARLFEILPYYNKTASQICDLFDSVYVSFYKGIGGLAGAILAGEKEFAEEAKVWKRRHGGDLISLYPYIVTADYYFDKRIHKMAQYHEDAKELAGLYNACPGITTLPEVPVSNMFHVHFSQSKETIEPILLDLYEQTGIGLSGHLRVVDDQSSYFEVSIGDQYANVPKQELEVAFQELSKRLNEI